MLTKIEIRKSRSREKKVIAGQGKTRKSSLEGIGMGGSRPSKGSEGLNVHTHSNKGRQRGRMMSD